MKTELDPRETGIRNIVADACFLRWCIQGRQISAIC